MQRVYNREAIRMVGPAAVRPPIFSTGGLVFPFLSTDALHRDRIITSARSDTWRIALLPIGSPRANAHGTNSVRPEILG